MNAVGWILILLLILVLAGGVFLLVWYFVKIRPGKKQPSPPGELTPLPPPSSYTQISMVTSTGIPEYAVTNDTNKIVILYDPKGPTGPTGPTGAFLNVCSRYSWGYAGGTGSIIPSVSGATGVTGTVSGATGSYLIASWETNENSKYITANTTTAPKSGDPLITGSTGTAVNSIWVFIPDTSNSSKGKMCLRGVTDKALCLHYGVTGGTPILDQQLTVKEFLIGDTDPGFTIFNIQPLSSPACNLQTL
jgi:hypothetical protein